jgi:hypothetical protein
MRKSSEIHADILAAWGLRQKANLRTLRLMHEMEESMGYFDFGCKNLFEYGVKIHRMSESEALSFQRISRTSEKMPELMEGILDGELTLTNGVVLSSLINDSKIPVEEKKAWIETAKDCSKNELQEKIADTRPDIAVKDRERKKKVSKTLNKVELWVTDEFLEMIEDLQSILGKSKMTPTLEWAVTDVLKRKDPVKHAERAKGREEKKKTPPSPLKVKDAKKPDQFLSKTQAGSSRPKTPAAEKHKVDLRDERRCTHIDSKTGERCNCKFGLEYHHSIPLASGGPDTADNIFTFCRDHHRQEHRYF